MDGRLPGKPDRARYGVVRRLDRGVGYSVPALPAASHWGQHFALMVNANKRHASISSVLPLVVAFQRELGQAGGAGSVASRLVREEIEMRGEAGSDD